MKQIKPFNCFIEYNFRCLSNNDLDIFKKASLALRYLSLIKGKYDIAEKSENNFFKNNEVANVGIRKLINIK